MPIITVINLAGKKTSWNVEPNANLRKALLLKGISPYTNYTKRLNCKGNGICATCGVWIVDQDWKAGHWHDKAAKHFQYPRLSCQILVDKDILIKLVDKKIWGSRKKKNDLS